MQSLRIITLLAMLSGGATGSALADKAILAGGCFWCMESDFDKLPGVLDVVSGFTGGTLKNPTYNGNHEGHYEAVEITYDPQKVSYRQLLDYYWRHIDPFDAGGQFCDRGHSYQSAVFVANDNERKIAEESKKAVAALFPKQTVVTPILAAIDLLPDHGGRELPPGLRQKQPRPLPVLPLGVRPRPADQGDLGG